MYSYATISYLYHVIKKGHIIIDTVCYHLFKGRGINIYVYLNIPSYIIPLGDYTETEMTGCM